MPVPFHRPTSLADAVRLKHELGAGAYYLAGGSELNNLHTGLRARELVFVGHLGLDGIEPVAGGWRLGANVTFQQIVEHESLPAALRTAAKNMANRNIRNVATVGGHIGSNRSCADLLPALLVLESSLRLLGPAGERDCGLEDWLAAPDGSLILSVRLDTGAGRGFGVAAHSRTANDLSIVTAAASLRPVGGPPSEVRLAIGGVAAHALRLPAVEAALVGKPLPSQDELEALIGKAVQPISDHRGSSGFKRQLASVLGARALRQAAKG